MSSRLASARQHKGPFPRFPNFRWSVRDVDQIEAWYKEGYEVPAIAARLNVSNAEIVAILRDVTKDRSIN